MSRRKSTQGTGETNLEKRATHQKTYFFVFFFRVLLGGAVLWLKTQNGIKFRRCFFDTQNKLPELWWRNETSRKARENVRFWPTITRCVVPKCSRHGPFTRFAKILVRRQDQNSTFSLHGPFTRIFVCRILRISAKDRGRLVLPGQAATVSCPIIPIYRPGAR